MSAPRELSAAGPVTRVYARAVVAGRWFVILGWVAVLVVMLQMPRPERVAGGLGDFVPPGSEAIRTEHASARAFGFPLTSRTVLVQRDEDGLSPYAQARAVVRALSLTLGTDLSADPRLRGGLPISNTAGLFPGSRERGTTVLTYMFASGTLTAQTRAIRQMAEEEMGPSDAYVGVTGSIPARVAQARIVQDWLPTLETVTLLAIIGIVATYFRSVTAPLVALVTAGLSFYLAVQAAAQVGAAFGLSVPDELEPLILALVLGIVTDYAIFFLAGMRARLVEGMDTKTAARATAGSTGPIVAVAGLTVAAGTAVMVVANSAFFSAFGPALALPVVVAAVVSLTLVPALLAVFGRFLYWPFGLRASSGSRLSAAAARQLARRRVAIALVTGCVVTLGALAAALPGLRLGLSFVPSLPGDTEARQAADAAAEGFAPGILSPTLLLVRGEDVAQDRGALRRLGNRLTDMPGVAGVVGPGDLVVQLERRVLTTASGDTARYLVVLGDEPLGATAIGTLERIRRQLPDLAQTVGLQDVDIGLGGDTAVAGELVEMTRQDLGRIVIAALLVNFLLLVMFLRSLVAPVFLLASSVLALAASLGALTLVFQGASVVDGITFYVPFASVVLLLSLGSDYNIFGVGYVWETAERMTIRQAIVKTIPETSSAITVAGVTLAASFGMLAIVPLQPFRELAFVMAFGILLDALVVRSLLVPAILSLLGPVGRWPRRWRPPPGTAYAASLATRAPDRTGEPS